MPRSLRTTLICAALAFTGVAEAAVFVTFRNADRYLETGFYRKDGPAAIKEIEAYLKHLGDTYLPADQTVRIEVVDIDLAGDQRMSRGGQEVRILTGGADFPRMTLRYTWERPGAESKSGEETISDMTYLQRNIPSTAPYASEKRMLESWFRKRFAQK